MTSPPTKICRRIYNLFALMGSSVSQEAENARDKLNKLLAKHRLSWNDLPAILSATERADRHNTRNTGTPSATAKGTTSAVNVLGLVVRLVQFHIVVKAEEALAIALWILHTYVFDRFSITPRLTLLSPVRGCGKTQLLLLIEMLVEEPIRTDDVTAAAIYHQLEYRPRSVWLIDEGDNLGLLNNRTLRAVFNSGHRRGGAVSRFVGGWTRRFRTFAPLAIAAIGMLPLPLLHRSIVINMQRAPKQAPIERLHESDSAFPAVRAEIHAWAQNCSLARDPEMPSSLRNRAADNCRPLLAIADALGHGEAARTALLKLHSNRPDEDPGVSLLADIRKVFLARKVDHIGSKDLLQALLELEHAFWAEWRGVNDDRSPHRLTQSELAHVLQPFGIRSKTISPLARKSGDDRTCRGYTRDQFEAAWAAYCRTADTAAHPSKIIGLPRS
jgi:hypothetical protein